MSLRLYSLNYLYYINSNKHNMNENAKCQTVADRIMHPFAEVKLLKYLSTVAIQFDKSWHLEIILWRYIECY